MTKLSQQDREDIRALRKANPRMWTQAALAKEFGVGQSTICFVLDPNNYEDMKQRRRRGTKNKATHRNECDRAAEMQRPRILAEDQRDLTARFFGDPPPGRSALDSRSFARLGTGAHGSASDKRPRIDGRSPASERRERETHAV